MNANELIILEGISLPTMNLEWLMKQDLQFLYGFIAKHYIHSQTKEGGSYGIPPDPHIQSILTLMSVIEQMRDAQPEYLKLLQEKNA